MKRLDTLKEGRSFVAVARHYGVNKSTLRYIKKDEANIRNTAAITVCTEAKRVATQLNEKIVKMEAELVLWITHCRKKT